MIHLSQISKTVQRHPFHLVDPSPWPFLASIAAFTCTVGGVMYMHAYLNGVFILSSGFIMLLLTMFV